MKTLTITPESRNSIRRFISDGLIGVVVALIFFLILTPIMLGSGLLQNNLIDYLRLMFFVSMSYNGSFHMLGPMPYVILVTFIGIGSSGRLLETNLWGRNWIMYIVKTSIVSFWTAVGLSVIYVMFIGILLVVHFILWSAIGVVLALLIGTLIWVAVRPQNRLSKMIIGSISSSLIGYIGGYLILILILTPID